MNHAYTKSFSFLLTFLLELFFALLAERTRVCARSTLLTNELENHFQVGAQERVHSVLRQQLIVLHARKEASETNVRELRMLFETADLKYHRTETVNDARSFTQTSTHTCAESRTSLQLLERLPAREFA